MHILTVCKLWQVGQAGSLLPGEAGLLRKAEVEAHRKVAMQVQLLSTCFGWLPRLCVLRSLPQYAQHSAHEHGQCTNIFDPVSAPKGIDCNSIWHQPLA